MHVLNVLPLITVISHVAISQHLTHTPPPFSPDLRAGEGETQSTIVLGNIAHSFLCSLHPRLTECHHNVSVVWGRGGGGERRKGALSSKEMQTDCILPGFSKNLAFVQVLA